MERGVGAYDLVAHHWPADDVAVVAFFAACLGYEVAHGRAGADAQDLWLVHAFAADGGVAFGQGFATDDGVVHGFHGAAVVADEAVVAGVLVSGDAHAEEEFEELARVAGGVAGGDAADFEARVVDVGGGALQGGDGLGFVVFDAEVDVFGTEDFGGDLCAVDDVSGVFADLQVIAGDVGFAFGGVDDEGVCWMAEFACGGESCAAKADDAAGGDAFAQGVGVGGCGV